MVKWVHDERTLSDPFILPTPTMSATTQPSRFSYHRETESCDGRPSDDELQALRNRDPRAVECWIYSQRDYLRSVLARFSRNPSAADDLVQEALFQALRSLPNFRGDAKVTTWLYVIARNVASQHTRYSDRYRPYDSDDLGAAAVTADGTLLSDHFGGEDPERATIHHEEETEIERALQQLKPSYREVIKLRDLKQHSTRETAEALNLSTSNVRVRLHRARKKLRELLADRLPHWSDEPARA